MQVSFSRWLPLLGLLTKKDSLVWLVGGPCGSSLLIWPSWKCTLAKRGWTRAVLEFPACERSSPCPIPTPPCRYCSQGGTWGCHVFLCQWSQLPIAVHTTRPNIPLSPFLSGPHSSGILFYEVTCYGRQITFLQAYLRDLREQNASPQSYEGGGPAVRHQQGRFPLSLIS